MNAGMTNTMTGRPRAGLLKSVVATKKARKPNQLTGKTRLVKKVFREEILCMSRRRPWFGAMTAYHEATRQPGQALMGIFAELPYPQHAGRNSASGTFAILHCKVPG